MKKWSQEEESNLISYSEWFQWNKSKETIIPNVRPFFSRLNAIAVSGGDEATGNKIGKWNGKKLISLRQTTRRTPIKLFFAQCFPPSSLKNEIIRIVINLILLFSRKQSSSFVVVDRVRLVAYKSDNRQSFFSRFLSVKLQQQFVNSFFNQPVA